MFVEFIIVLFVRVYSDKCWFCKNVFKKLKWMFDELNENWRKCYMCEFIVDFDYLCDDCYSLNSNMKKVICDLKGRYVVVIGGWIKIGFEIIFCLLRDGCFVIVIIWFLVNVVECFSKEIDFSVWKYRLKIVWLDF